MKPMTDIYVDIVFLNLKGCTYLSQNDIVPVAKLNKLLNGILITPMSVGISVDGAIWESELLWNIVLLCQQYLSLPNYLILKFFIYQAFIL
jgi:hypothetical protein